MIPAGAFEMGDHHAFVDPQHESDEVPIHKVRLDAFHIGIHDVTTRAYCDFLNGALAGQQIELRKGGAYLVSASDLLFEIDAMSAYGRISWNGKSFAVLDARDEQSRGRHSLGRRGGLLQLGEPAAEPPALL